MASVIVNTILTKQQVIDKFEAEGLKQCCEWLQKQSETEKIPLTSLRSSVTKVVKDLKDIKKGKSRLGFTEQLDSFKSEVFVLPKSLEYPRKCKRKCMM